MPENTWAQSPHTAFMANKMVSTWKNRSTKKPPLDHDSSNRYEVQPQKWFVACFFTPSKISTRFESAKISTLLARPFTTKNLQFVSELTVNISSHQRDIFDDLEGHRSPRTKPMTHKILFWYAKPISSPALRYQWRMNYTLDQNVVLSDPLA